MGATAAAEVDAWLRDGGLVVTANERAARAFTASYHRARRAEGMAAWPAPGIHNWELLVRAAWEERCPDDRMVLNTLQEQSLWAKIGAADGGHSALLQAVLLESPRHRVARLAMDAQRLLCLYAPQFLRSAMHTAWQQDAGAFGRWLSRFDEECRAQKLLSAARLPLELASALEKDTGERPPLLLVGFDRILPTQRAFFDAWGAWREKPHTASAGRIFFYDAADANAELTACALWCGNRLAADPNARLLVITQDLDQRRGEIERAFLRFTRTSLTALPSFPLFEFSLGIPLSQTPLARGAQLLLRWLNSSIAEHEIDWLLSTGLATFDAAESRQLVAFVRALRRRNLQRPQWELRDWIAQKAGIAPPGPWVMRAMQAAQRLEEFARKRQTAIAWAELVPQLLQLIGWPGERALTSAEFQVSRAWQQIVDECASLGFDGSRMDWNEFLAALKRTADETLFAPESQDTPILIAGPAESAGLTADHIWFLGTSEDAWPASGAKHPLLPIDLQREAGMPHASAQSDWQLAATTTARLLASAPDIHFSYARQNDDMQARPSRVILNVAGVPLHLPTELQAPETPAPLTVLFEDRSQVPFPFTGIQGGSALLTAQSQCAFKAFATARLAAQPWQPAEAGLTAAQRGLLLHAVLHSVWSEPPAGMRSSADLVNQTDLRAFVEKHVRRVLVESMPDGARERMPKRYLELEEPRLIHLVTEWLSYEATRAPFTVIDTEMETDASINGLSLKLRLDRLDRLDDGTMLVIDYKTGDVSPDSWELPRPDDVQLPLYAGFALNRETEPLGGLVFARIRAGDLCFTGRMGDAKGQLLPALDAKSRLVQASLTVEELGAWREHIEDLVRGFIEGSAAVDPRDYPQTCARCGLQTLCRIQEMRAQLASQGEEAEVTNDA